MVALLSLLLVAVLALAACGGGLETVPQAGVEAGQEGVGVVTDADAEVDLGADADVAAVDVDAAEAVVTDEDIATDTETVVVGAAAEAPEGSVETVTETGTEVVTDTIVVTAVTDIVTDVTIIEDVSTDVEVITEDADLDVEGAVVTETESSTDVVASADVDVSADAMASATAFRSGAGVEGAGAVLVTASSLNGYNFDDINGEGVGNVNSIIIDPMSGQIHYLVVEYGGFLTLGQSQIPVPLNAFTMIDADTLVANFDQNMLDQFPYTDDNWMENDGWNQDAVDFWGGMGFGEASFGDTATPAIAGATQFVQAEDIIGRQVALATEADDMGNSGNIDDLLLDLARGYAKYLLVDVGDIEVDGMYAVPFTAFDFSQVGDVYTFNDRFDNTWLNDAPVTDRAFLTDPTVAPNMAADNDAYWNERGFFGDWGM
jgi:sporulation protein YlmC with PRC-barrel domain